MSVRTLVFLGVFGFGIVAAFVFPPAGVWGFLLESNYPPEHHWWGRPLIDLIGPRWSFYVGTAMVLGLLLHWDRYAAVRLWKHPQTKLLLVFTLNAFLVTQWAYDTDASWKMASDHLKWFLVYICIVKTHSDRRWLPVVLLIYILAAIHVGWDNTFDPKGSRSVKGGPVTALGDNFLAAHMIALMPLAALYAMSSSVKPWLRVCCLLGAPLMLNVVAHASSRGAFVAMVAAGFWLVLAAQGRLRRIAIMLIVLGSLVSLRLFHEQFWRRLATIDTYQEESSAVARVEAWKDAWRLSQINPVGYGGEAFDRGLSSQPKTTHNMFFEILVAWGWQGAVLFFAFIALTCWDCWKLRGVFWQPGQGWAPSREYLDTVGVFVGLVSMLVAAVFLNRVAWELWWVFGAYTLCLKNVAASAATSRSSREMVTISTSLSYYDNRMGSLKYGVP